LRFAPKRSNPNAPDIELAKAHLTIINWTTNNPGGSQNALASRRFGAYTLQAAIAAVYAEASSSASTDWRQITLLYNRLIRIKPSPVVELNRAVAIAMCEGSEQGLRLIDALLAREDLASYHLAHSARADLCRRLGRLAEARDSYEKALALVRCEPERRFLAGRLRELE
jgi:RNA polymerase sigma-70 factor (ECF subfamily)